MRVMYCLLGMMALFASSSLYASYNLNAPNTSSGRYAVTWSNSSGGYYTLQERRDGGRWEDILTSTSVRSKYFSKTVTGIYDYRIKHRAPCYRYCSNGPYYYYYSSVDTTRVTVRNGAKPRAPSNVQGPSSDNDGAFPITWNPSIDFTDSFTVQQSRNNGGWTTVGSTTGTAMWMTGKSNGSYKYRVRSCNKNGCGSYSTYFYGAVRVAMNSSTPVNITYSYDELGRLTTVTDNKAGKSEFEYDETGNRVNVTTNNDKGNQK